MAAETEERQRKEEELRKRLQEAQEASENGTIQLYKKMAMENAAREAEIAELRYIYYLKYQVYQKKKFVCQNGAHLKSDFLDTLFMLSLISVKLKNMRTFYFFSDLNILNKTINLLSYPSSLNHLKIFL